MTPRVLTSSTRLKPWDSHTGILGFTAHSVVVGLLARLICWAGATLVVPSNRYCYVQRDSELPSLACSQPHCSRRWRLALIAYVQSMLNAVGVDFDAIRTAGLRHFQVPFGNTSHVDALPVCTRYNWAAWWMPSPVGVCSRVNSLCYRGYVWGKLSSRYRCNQITEFNPFRVWSAR